MVSTGKRGATPKAEPVAQEGAEILAEAIKEPTLDTYLDRNPKELSDQDRVNMVAILRRQREMFITADANKRAGIKPTEEDTNGEVHGEAD